MSDEFDRALAAGDAIKALDIALREAGARVTFDSRRTFMDPCYSCRTTTEPRELVEVGRYTRPRICGNSQVGDAIARPLCASCRMVSAPTAPIAMPPPAPPAPPAPRTYAEQLRAEIQWRRIPPGVKIDPRRDSMIWMMWEAGLWTQKQLAELFGISTTAIGVAVGRRREEIRAAARRERTRPTLAATLRLAAAGALPDDTHIDYPVPSRDPFPMSDREGKTEP